MTTSLISRQADQYLKENLIPGAIPTPSAEQIVELRRDTYDACEPGIKQIQEELGPGLTESLIGGINCLEVTPENQDSGLLNARILYFYGGGFIGGSPEEDLPITAVIAAQLGIKVICPRYRLAPEYPYPAAMDDGMAVYKVLLETFAPDRLLLCGESAGGNLALQLVLRSLKSGMPAPAAMALLSPWVDLSNGGDSLTSNDGRDPSLSLAWVNSASAMFSAGYDLTDPDLSPLFAELPSAVPPTLITSGSRDLLLSHCLSLATKMRLNGLPVELRVWEEMWHVFEWYPELPEARQSLIEISQFLANYLES